MWLTFVFFGLIFFHLAKNILLIKPDGWYVGQVNLWGDLPLHLGLINSFLEQGKIIISSPIFAHSLPNYPILPDLATAILVRLGLSLPFSLFIQTFFLGIALIFFARLLIKTLEKNEMVVFLTLFLFFMSGGFGFYYFLRDLSSFNGSIIDFLTHLPREYTNIKELGYWWINPLLAYFLPQRTTLFGFPVGLLILFLLWQGYQSRKIILFVLAGLLAGILPVIHPQSLIAIFLLLIFFVPTSLITSKQRAVLFFPWLLFLSITVFLGIPLFFSLSSQAVSSLKFIRWQVGWTAHQENLIWFWFKNLGAFWPLYLLALSWTFKNRRRIFLIHLPFFCLFIIVNLIIFQPWDFDNAKILLYWFLAASFIVANFIINFFSKKGIATRIIVIIIILLATFSSSLDLWRTFTPVSAFQLFSSEDLKLAENVKLRTSPLSVFLTSQNHNHPISALTGRSTFLGYEGWLWSHGINYYERKELVAKMFAGDKDLLKEFEVNYVVVGPSERQNFKVNEAFFKENFPLVYQSQNYQIYQVR